MYLSLTRMQVYEAVKYVLPWRTSQEVSQCLFTDLKEPTESSQVVWFNKITENREAWWMINVNNEHVGVLWVYDIDQQHLRGKMGLYFGKAWGSKFADIVVKGFYRYYFRSLGWRKLMVEVFCWNNRAIELHKRCGYRIVGIMKDHVYKDNAYHDVVLMELTSSQFIAQREFSLSIKIEPPFNTLLWRPRSYNEGAEDFKRFEEES